MAGYRSKPPTGGVLNRADPLVAGKLTGAYLFGETAGPTLADATGRHPLTPAGGVTYPTREYGRAVLFDGSSGYCTSALPNLGAGDFTVAAVVTRVGSTGTTQVVMSNDNTNDRFDGLYYLAIDADGVNGGVAGAMAFFNFETLTGIGATGVIATGSPTAIVASRIAGTVRLYASGRQVASGADTTDFAAAVAPMVARRPQGDLWLDGSIHALYYAVGRGWTAPQARAFAADPFRPFRPQSRLRAPAVATAGRRRMLLLGVR